MQLLVLPTSNALSEPIAAAALVIAIGSFVISSVLAARAVGAAERSAHASEVSAAASERSAGATEESARIAAAVRYREDAPDFRLTPLPPRSGQLPIEITMLSGPMLRIRLWDYVSEVTLPPNEHGGADTKIEHEYRVDPSTELIKNASFLIYVECEEGAVSAGVRILLECEETAEEGRRWPFIAETRWPEP